MCALIARLTSTQASASERAGGSRLEAGRLGRRQRLVLAGFGAAAQAHLLSACAQEIHGLFDGGASTGVRPCA